MRTFKTWLENLETHKVEKIKKLWGDTLKVLVGAIDDDQAIAMPLSRITHQGQSGSNANIFKGKHAVLKKLSGADIFSQLQELDPELAQGVQDAQNWLGNSDGGKFANNADTTIGSLLKKLFGEYFESLLDGKFKSTGKEAKLQKAPPAAPEDNAAPNQNPVPQQQPDMGMQNMQQPQMPQNGMF